MSEYGREALKAVAVVLLVVLLGVVIYHTFPAEFPSVAFALVWSEGGQSVTLEEEIWYFHALSFSEDILGFNFTFVNGSWIGNPRFLPDGDFLISGIEHGKFDATELERIVARPYQFIIWNEWQARNLSMTYTIKVIRDYTLNATLVEATEITELGVYQNLNHNSTLVTGIHPIVDIGVELCSGYWTPPRDWVINTTKLTSMLEGSGTASINFDLRLNVNIKYNMTLAGVPEIGETNLQGEGRLGTITFNYDQGKIIWVSYDFHGVRLLMLAGRL